MWPVCRLRCEQLTLLKWPTCSVEHEWRHAQNIVYGSEHEAAVKASLFKNSVWRQWANLWTGVGWNRITSNYDKILQVWLAPQLYLRLHDNSIGDLHQYCVLVVMVTPLPTSIFVSGAELWCISLQKDIKVSLNAIWLFGPWSGSRKSDKHPIQYHI